MEVFKHEDLENRATINQVPLTTDQLSISALYHPKDKFDEALEQETRGVDFKGNVRYFCPKCNVRYIGELRNNFLTNELSLTLIFHFNRVQILENSSQGMWKRPRVPNVPTEVQTEANVHCTHEEEAWNHSST